MVITLKTGIRNAGLVFDPLFQKIKFNNYARPERAGNKRAARENNG